MAKKVLWNGTATDWTIASGWTPAGVPTATSIAVFATGAAGAYTVTGSPPVAANKANVGEIEVNGDKVTLTGTFNTKSIVNKDIPTGEFAYVGIRVDHGGTLTLAPQASVTVFNGASFFGNMVGQVFVGATSAGSLVLEGTLSDSGVAIGLFAPGAAVVSGASAVWTTGIGINVGLSTASGSLLIRDGALVKTFAMQIGGGGSTAAVQVTGAGSRLIATDTLEVQGMPSSLVITGGGTVSCPDLDFSGKSVVALDAASHLVGDISLVGGILEAIPEANETATTVVDLANPMQLLEQTVNTVLSLPGAILELDGKITNFFHAGGLTIGGGAVLLTNDANRYSAGTTIDSGVLGLAAPQAAGTGKILFAHGAGATLLVAAGAVPANTIAGFAVGDTIDLLGVTYGAGLHAAFDTATDVLTLKQGTTVEATLTFASGASFPAGFHLAADGSTGTAITVASHA